MNKTSLSCSFARDHDRHITENNAFILVAVTAYRPKFRQPRQSFATLQLSRAISSASVRNIPDLSPFSHGPPVARFLSLFLVLVGIRSIGLPFEPPPFQVSGRDEVMQWPGLWCRQLRCLPHIFCSCL